MLYLTYVPDTGTYHVIFDTWYSTPVLVMLYLTHDTGHRYLPCYIWHLIYYTDIWYAILATRYITPVFDILYLPPDIWHRYLTCYTCHLIYDTGTWHMLSPGPSTLDLILWPLTGYYYTWHVYYLVYAWLLYYYQTSGNPVSPILLYLLYSWIHVLMYLLYSYSC